MKRVAVPPATLRWALERSSKTPEMLAKRLPKLPNWLIGELAPTFKQLEAFAKATYTPLGFFFLPEPPEEPVPIPDFRTFADKPIARPSADLLDTIYVCQHRQDWYHDFVRAMGERPLAFVGSVEAAQDVVGTAARIREELHFDLEERRELPTWTDALRRFIEQADAAGVLVMVSGIVGNNTRRKLDPREFRGFALVDNLAPLVFINGADSKAAQMFTLAHELVHIWLGQSALSDVEARTVPDQQVEGWCNRVAAEILVPLAVLQAEYAPGADLGDELNRLARRFKVSTLVILRRIHDAGSLTLKEFWGAYKTELERLRDLSRRKGGGGNFYRTLAVRVSERFSRALVASTLEGHTLYRDAFHMLGIKKGDTFREFGARLGYPA